MPPFKFNQGHLKTEKQNVLSLSIIVGLIFILTIQIWLLYSAVNNALAGKLDVVLPAFIASLVLFVIALGGLKYLPRDSSES